MVESLFYFLSLALLATAASSVDAECTDVHIVFARGSGELQGLGICGSPLVSGITKELQGTMSVSSYAVRYGASVTQLTAGSGANDMTSHVIQVAQDCPKTSFVLGGYSQGASVVDISLGIRTMLGVGKSIPEELAPRIMAIVTFGNPLKLAMGGTIAKRSQLYGPKSIDFCDFGHPVCAGGVNVAGHVTYPVDGSVTKGAKRAAELVRQGRSSMQSSNQNQGDGESRSMNNGGSSNTGGGNGFPSFSSVSSLLPKFPSFGGSGANSGSSSTPSFGFSSLRGNN